MPKQSIQKANPKSATKSSLQRYVDGLSECPVDVKTCKVCQSEFRARAEAEYEKCNHSVSAALTLLRNLGEDVSKSGVYNHMSKHYDPVVRKDKIQQYAVELDSYLGDQQDRRIQLRERIYIMQRMMYDLAADSNGCSLDDKRKNADVIKKLSDGVTGLEDKIMSLDKSMEPVEVLIERLGIIFRARMKKLSDNNVKSLLMDILTEVQQSSQDLFTEESE